MFDPEKIKKTLAAIAEADLTRPEEVRDNALMLENLLLDKKIAPSGESEIMTYLTKNGLLKKLNSLYEKFETDLEIDHAKEILGNNLDYRQYLMYKRFFVLIKKEIKLAKIEKQSKVLFIGSGPFPITAILLNSLKGCAVDCYEKNREYAALSVKVISQLGLADKIRIKNRNGKFLSDDNYSVIIVALLARPKDQILKEISEKISSHTGIICRTSDNLRQAFYEPTNPDCLTLCKIMGKNYAKGEQTISSVLLKKA